MASLLLALILAGQQAIAQGINVGSDGSDGAFVFVPDSGPGANPVFMTVDLSLAASGLDGQGQPITWQTPAPVAGRGVYDPDSWAVVFKYSTASVPAGKIVVFAGHPSGAPVVWLVQQSCTIAGEISLNGNSGGGWPPPGPGGFRGGLGRTSVSIGGMGPGGGPSSGTNANSSYGSPACFPLIGGSGTGSPATNCTVSASGGGAMLIAAGDTIHLLGNSGLRSQGLVLTCGGTTVNSGGGCFRLVADTIVKAETANFILSGVAPGRIRLETNSFLGTLSGNPLPTLGFPGQLFPDAMTPTVRVVSVTGGGPPVLIPQDPRAGLFPMTTDAQIPSTGPVTILLEARNVAPGRSCSLRVLNVVGTATTYTSTPLVGTQALSTATVTLTLSPAVYAMQARVVL